MNMRQLAQAVKQLPALSRKVKFGDCIEVDRYPEDCRRYIEYPLGVKIRQVGITKWRVWLISYNA